MQTMLGIMTFYSTKYVSRIYFCSQNPRQRGIGQRNSPVYICNSVVMKILSVRVAGRYCWSALTVRKTSRSGVRKVR